MASESKTVTVVPLSGSNYPTWKVQCRMALMRDGLWNIVNGTETLPATDREGRTKFLARKDRALATIVLSVDPSLLYLIGDPADPVAVWKKLGDQFQKKTWVNKLELRRKLHSLRLREGDSVQDHIKTMIELFDGLSVVGDPVTDEDRVVFLLASLPESYNMLVTALEANAEVPKMEVVTEWLLHEERKLKDRTDNNGSSERGMVGKQRIPKRRGPKCHHCAKFGHIRRNCPELAQSQDDQKRVKQKANHAALNYSSSESEGVGLMANHVLSAGQLDGWIVDSGATSHMCNDKQLFTELFPLEKPTEVMLGDGHALDAAGSGSVLLDMRLPSGKTKRCRLINVLYVPSLAYNLLSVSRVAQSGKVTKCGRLACQILDSSHKLIARATKVGSLYHLDCGPELASVADRAVRQDVWHRQFGHLGTNNLQKLAKNKLVDGFDYKIQKEVRFCESCVEGKQHRNRFPVNENRRAREPLDLVHSDLCGKMNTRSLSGAEYFLTFIDDKTRYVWVYVLKHKDEVFTSFCEWKSMVERSTGRKLKTLRTDNGGEYTSRQFKFYLRTEGVRHELTVPKTPEQNGVAERMNRTLVESVRSMLADSDLPQTFWAEALSTAVYLRNRSPTVAVPNSTPYEAWTGDKPSVKLLRVFGCAAYAHIPRDERHKLDPKTRKCILMGYGMETKGYRLYDPERRKIFYSRDVQFNELKNGLEKEPQEQNVQKYVQLKSSSDDELQCDAPPEPVLRRSGRERRSPHFYGEWATVSDVKEPTTFRQALNSLDKEEWMNAMKQEI